MVKELTDRIDLKPARFSLHRVWPNDEAGDSGLMLLSINPKTNETTTNALIVGQRVRVGSPYARSYQMQDFWTTTPIVTLWSINETTHGFTTHNSEYRLEVF